MFLADIISSLIVMKNMNKVLKYAGLLAILTIFVVAAAPDYIGEADAAKAEGSPGIVPPKSYGQSTQDVVCGGSLCSELQGNN